MDNEKNYLQVFCDIFDIDQAQARDLKFQGIPAWDSVGHLQLMNAIEKKFAVSVEPEDILNFNSYKAGREILKKYDIQF